jgi:hypothetical protein
MERLGESLAAALLPRIEKELGREATLRLLWPQIVGTHLAENTELRAARGTDLKVGVRDRHWMKTLDPLQGAMLDAINRWTGGRYKNIELVEQPGMMHAASPNAGKLKISERRGMAAGINTAVIPDEEMRERFRQSAEKYLAAQAALRPSREPEEEPR